MEAVLLRFPKDRTELSHIRSHSSPHRDKAISLRLSDALHYKLVQSPLKYLPVREPVSLQDLPVQTLLPDTLPAPSLLLQEPRFLLLKGPLYTPADDLPVPYPYVPSSPVPV